MLKQHSLTRSIFGPTAADRHPYSHGVDINMLTPIAAVVALLSTAKKRAPRAIKAIKRFASRAMNTKYVKVDTTVNKYIWKQGIRNVPYRIRVQLHRKRNEEEDATHKLYTHVTLVNVPTFKGLQTKTVKEQDA
jgi:large subunit ribosomal protein L31e